MKNTLIATFVLVVAVLAGVVAYRLSADALAIIVGVVLGFLALIPALIILVLVLRRREPEAPPVQTPAFNPPVVVVSGYPQMPPSMLAQQPVSPYGSLNPPMLPAPQPQRQFRVMGYEATDHNDPRGVDAGWSAYEYQG